MDDTAITDRWQWRMKTPKSEADSQAPSFKDVWQAINPLQHIPIVGSIYRALTGDEPTPAARAVGGLIYGGPVGLIAAGVSGLASEIAGGDPLQKSVARMAGKDAPPVPEVASAKAPEAKAADEPEASPAPLKAAPAEVAATAPSKPETPPKPAAREVEKEVAALATPVAAEVDPYAKFQPKRTTIQHGSRIAQNLAALNMAALTGPTAQPAEAKPAPQPSTTQRPEPTPLAQKSTAAPKPAATPIPIVPIEVPGDPPPAAAPAVLARARDVAPKGSEAGGQTQAWFSQAVLGALDRYREAGGLRPPAPTSKSVDTTR